MYQSPSFSLRRIGGGGGGGEGIRELKLAANKIEQMLNYRESSFPTSVPTTFVAHYSLQLRLMRGVFSNVNYISRMSQHRGILFAHAPQKVF